MQLIAALQVLAAFWYGAFAFHHLTGASTGTSFLIGGVGAFVLVLVVVIKFPRLVLGTATLCWAVAGVMLGHWLFGGIGQALVVGVILAGIGFTANAGFIAEMLASHRKGEAIAESILPPIASAKDREGVLLLWHAVRRLDRIKVLDDDMFRSLNGRCAEILGMPNPPEGSAPPSTHDVADAFEAVSLLKANGLVSEDAAVRIKSRIEAWWATRTAPAPVPPVAVVPLARPVERPEQLTDTQREVLAGLVFRLVENRALSFETFVRVMVQLNPDYDASRLSAQSFPFADDADRGDLEVIERLKTLGLITAEEYRRGLQVILPYIHEKSA